MLPLLNIIPCIVAEKRALQRVGCFGDKAQRAMTGLWFDSKRMTNELCVQTCAGMVRSIALHYLCHRYIRKRNPVI